MGRPKLLLPWGDKTILEHLIQQWTAVGCSQIGAVIGPDSILRDHLADVEPIINRRPEQGMYSSVQCAARWDGWNKTLTHFVITLGDQPQVKTDTLKAIIEFAEKHPRSICQPARNGRGRHPVVLPEAMFSLLSDSKERNLKEFLAVRERVMFESDDAGLDLDLDTPEDYQKALNTRPANSGAPFS
jgi:molybdenum cofactor cytidylyltransferase